MKSTYLFISGVFPDLSRAELTAVYPHATLVYEGRDFLMIETDETVSQKTFDRLGGFLKAAQIIERVSSKSDVKEVLVRLLEDLAHGEKIEYGVSLYGSGSFNLKYLLLDLKKALKEADVKSRFINKDFTNISAAQYKSLRKKGVEIVILMSGKDFYIGKTVGMQDIDAYSKRDYEKPFRDMKMGMLPPKLAQIMINLAGAAGTIWDPFCGAGVILMEGLLMGLPVVGSDIDPKHLEGARQNLEWLQREFDLESGQYNLFVHDAKKTLPSIEFDAIVCEGYLGPPLFGTIKTAQLSSTLRELDSLYFEFFRSLQKRNIKSPIVIALPLFKTAEGEVRLQKTLASIQSMGFKIEIDLKYLRLDQNVGREIVRFRLI